LVEGREPDPRAVSPVCHRPALPSIGQSDTVARGVSEGTSRALHRVTAQGCEDQANVARRFCENIRKNEDQ
jgi:hypothetical protein